MRSLLSLAKALLLVASLPCVAGAAAPGMGPAYLPDEGASKIVTVSKDGTAAAGVSVVTQALVTKESGSKKTLKRFGEVYAFVPPFIAVHRDEPTMISIRNLQDDDEHDFMLVDPQSRTLMHVMLPPLQEISYVFTFHDEGLFTFYCTMHQPDMNGQILVLPPARRAP